MDDTRIASVRQFVKQLDAVNAEAERFKLLPPSPLRDAVIKERRLTAQHYVQHILQTLRCYCFVAVQVPTSPE
jgi:hypothetical protein